MIAIGNIGTTEFLVILAIALIFFGPRRLPGVANALGKTLREFRKALNEVKSEIAQADVTKDIAEVHRDIADMGRDLAKVDTTTSPPAQPAPDLDEPTGDLAAAVQPTLDKLQPKAEPEDSAEQSEETAGGDDGDSRDPDVPQDRTG